MDDCLPQSSLAACAHSHLQAPVPTLTPKFVSFFFVLETFFAMPPGSGCPPQMLRHSGCAKGYVYIFGPETLPSLGLSLQITKDPFHTPLLLATAARHFGQGMPCDIHAPCMQHTWQCPWCKVGAAHLKHTHNIHAAPMHHPCNTHAISMQHVCNTHTTNTRRHVTQPQRDRFGTTAPKPLPAESWLKQSLVGFGSVGGDSRP